MTTVLEAPRPTHTRIPRQATRPCVALVLLAPSGEVADCRASLDSALAQGAVTFAREIPAVDGMGALGAAIEAIADAVDHAGRIHPGLPVVLIGHSAAALAAHAYAELYPEDLAGVVITRAASQAA